jgi:hypothetical protein
MASKDFKYGPVEGQDNGGANSANRVLHPLHEAAYRLADMGISEKRSKTKDLIGLLLCHGARAWRYSQPEANIHLHVSAQAGRFPVILRLR